MINIPEKKYIYFMFGSFIYGIYAGTMKNITDEYTY